MLKCHGHDLKPRKAASPPAKPDATKVLAAFNTWAFKREQPTEFALLQKTISAAIDSDSQVSFVLYWGKGPRRRSSTAEDECLAFLQQMAARIEAVYSPGVAIKLILTDTHAVLNGHSADSITEYFATVTHAAALRGFTTCRLSSVVADYAVETPVVVTQPGILTTERLQKCAAKWYRGENGITDAAAQYYAMNMREKVAVQRRFPSTIFVTFNGREYRELFPDALPIFYMYSMRKGVSIKPWFVVDPPLTTQPIGTQPKCRGTIADHHETSASWL